MPGALSRPPRKPDRLRASIGTKLVVMVSLLIMVLALFTMVFFPQRMGRIASQGMERRALALGQVVADAVAPGVEFDDDHNVQQLLQTLKSVPEVEFAAVYRPNGTRMAAFPGDGIPARAPSRPAELTLEPAAGHLVLAAPVNTRIGERGSLLLGFSTRDVDEEKAADRLTVGVVALVMLVTGVLVAMLMARVLVRPLRQLTQISSQVVRHGDLTATVHVHSQDEAGELAGAFQQMVDKLSDVLTRVAALSGEVSHVVVEIQHTQDQVSRGAQSIGRCVRETAALAAVPQSLSAVTEQVATMHEDAVRSSGWIAQVRDGNSNVARHVHAMTASVASIADSTLAMNASTREVGAHIEAFNASLRQTSQSMRWIESTTSAVESNANEAARLAGQVRHTAEQGLGAAQQSLAAMQEIQAAARGAAEALTALGAQAGRMDTWTSSVAALSARTHELAQRARIMVSSSGGRSADLGTMADQIGELAKRSHQATQGMEELLRSIRHNMELALAAMTRSVTAAEREAKTGDATRTAFAHILALAGPCAERATGIAQTTARQTQRTAEITRAIHLAAGTSDRIKKLTDAQARTTAAVTAHVERLSNIGADVAQATESQARVSHQVTRALMGIGRMSQQLKEARQSEMRRSEEVRRAVQEIGRVATQQEQAVMELGNALGNLVCQVGELRGEMQRFRFREVPAAATWADHALPQDAVADAASLAKSAPRVETVHA